MSTRCTFVSLLAALLAMPVAAAAGVREDWQLVADAAELAGQEAAAQRIRHAVERISDEELERIYGKADLVGLAEGFVVSGEALSASRASITKAEGGGSALVSSGDKSAGLPSAQGYPSSSLCPFSPDRSNADDLLIAVDAIRIARVLLEDAKVLWSGLSRACGETIVILGEGGNTELACIPADVALFIAETLVGAAESTVEHIIFCDAAVDAAEIEGSYERAGHIHTDLTVHDADIKSQVATHDTDIKSQLATHDADVKALLANIQGTVDENQRLIRISMSRQLEVMRLLITPQGQRAINLDVLTCTGDDCPQTIQCQGGDLDWPCR